MIREKKAFGKCCEISSQKRDACWLCIVFANQFSQDPGLIPSLRTVSFGSCMTWDTCHTMLMLWDMTVRLMVCSSKWLVQKLTLGQKQLDRFSRATSSKDLQRMLQALWCEGAAHRQHITENLQYLQFVVMRKWFPDVSAGNPSPSVSPPLPS